jgi:hypothetical protein
MDFSLGDSDGPNYNIRSRTCYSVKKECAYFIQSSKFEILIRLEYHNLEFNIETADDERPAKRAHLDVLYFFMIGNS